MKILVLGASGATGNLVVRQLIKRQNTVRIVIRKDAVLPREITGNPLIEIKRGNITEFTDAEMTGFLRDCDAIVSCLGHNITFKGMFGEPRNLVSDAIRSICRITKVTADKKIKLVLMSTTAYTNAIAGEKNLFGEGIVFLILKLLLPPHRDNVRAADFLQKEIGKDDEKIEWIAVRPDTLINSDMVGAYEAHESPVRSPVFNAGTTSRINVSHFIAELLTDDRLWQEWKFKMPVLYNKQ